jgi:hypothetical protein
MWFGISAEALVVRDERVLLVHTRKQGDTTSGFPLAGSWKVRSRSSQLPSARLLKKRA